MEKFMTDKKVVLSLTVGLEDVPGTLLNHFSVILEHKQQELYDKNDAWQVYLREREVPATIKEVDNMLEHMSDITDLYTELRSILVGLQKTHLEIASPSEGEKIDQVDPSGSSEPE
jgi:hypothetical protein|tara:strand:- start:337 stop:684 length:348 start_codon:yes stop_codon:yes gene_type:complete